MRRTSLLSRDILRCADIDRCALFVLSDKIREAEEVDGLGAEHGLIQEKEDRARDQRKHNCDRNLRGGVTGPETGDEKRKEKEADEGVRHRDTGRPLATHLLHGGRKGTGGEAEIGRDGGNGKGAIRRIRFMGEDALILVLGGFKACSTTGVGSG